MTTSASVPSFLLEVLKVSPLGVRIVCWSDNYIGIDRCPFTRAHEDAPNLGAVIVMDPERRREEFLLCRDCGPKAAHEVLRLHSFQNVFLAFVRWEVGLSHPQPATSGDGEPVAGA
jgi:hypothetical protein